MFIVTEADAAAIRAAFGRGGELSAAVELPPHGAVALSTRLVSHGGARSTTVRVNNHGQGQQTTW
jgi:hypothetical protein